MHGQRPRRFVPICAPGSCSMRRSIDESVMNTTSMPVTDAGRASSSTACCVAAHGSMRSSTSACVMALRGSTLICSTCFDSARFSCSTWGACRRTRQSHRLWSLRSGDTGWARASSRTLCCADWTVSAIRFDSPPHRIRSTRWPWSTPIRDGCLRDGSLAGARKRRAGYWKRTTARRRSSLDLFTPSVSSSRRC